MFNNADQTPVLIASDSIVNIALSVPAAQKEKSVLVYPSITTNGRVFIETSNTRLLRIELFNSAGMLVSSLHFRNENGPYSVVLPDEQSVYLMKIETSSGIFYRKIVRQ